LIFALVEFQQGRSLTLVVQPRFHRLCGPVALTYTSQPRHDGSCRLVVRLNVGATTPLQRGWRVLLAWGDLVMMRKQLLTFKQLAERQAASLPPAAA
jgi:hypothetical protein